MKRKLLILLLCTGLCLILYSLVDGPKGVRTEGNDSSGDISPPAADAGICQDVLLQLADLLEDEREEATLQLQELASREDVVGYLANLNLAERELESPTSDVFYRRALALHSTQDVHFQLAYSLADQGRVKEAITEYLTLLPAQEALEALEKLDAPMMEIAWAFIRSNHRQRTVDYIQQIINLPELSPSERLELTAALGESYAILGRFGEALPYLKEVYEEGQTEVSFWYARSLEGTGATTKAISIYEEMGADGAHRLGNIFLQQGKREEGAQILSQSNHAMARWQSARLWEELDQPSMALKIYQELAKGETRYRDDAAYRAYILLKRMGLDGTQQMLEILKEYPAWSIRITGEGNWSQLDDSPIEKPSFLYSVQRMEEMGYPEWGKIELAIHQRNLSTPEMLALGHWHYQRGDYYLSTVWGMRSLHTEKTQSGYQLAYPRPFEETVLKVAELYRVKPHLIWAVMREESHFRPAIASPAGAMGLMQIMPATGLEIAGRLNMHITPRDLLNPEINISFGVFYLRQMLNQFEESIDKALAAYNGGPGNVMRWSNSPLGTTPADFPTAITFLETREYITKVLNTYHTYNWLYDEG